MSKRQAERVSRLRREKRGVVLLVVVSILTLFLMVGVTYVLIAGHYHNSSKQNQLAKRYGDEPEREMEEIIGQVMYGTAPGLRSVISPHSLLADLYGNERVIGTVAIVPGPGVNPTFLNGGQTMQIQMTLSVAANPIPNYYAGRVITFTDGSAAGISTRIMTYIPPSLSASGSPEVMVEAPESDLPVPVVPGQGNRFVINGAPFNGTGAGYLTPNLDASFTPGSGTTYSVAYLPNHLFLPPGLTPAVGGMDEPYDIPNWDNMFLAFVPPSKMSATVPDRVGNEANPPLPILPSFHRPDLVRFWMNALASSPLMAGVMNPQQAFLFPYGPDGIRGNGDDPLPTLALTDELVAIKRMIILRPLLEDHPNFTGGNQYFRADRMAFYNVDSDNLDMDGSHATGADQDSDGDGIYDVDNDGDGIAESIWIDPGLPVVTAANGRRYKRLVAIYIKDQDGRVNPNVHGNQILATTPSARTAAGVTDTFAGLDPTAGTTVYLPRGLGFGPSEVDFRHIFNTIIPYSSANDDTAVYNSILDQRYFTNMNQAYRPGYSNPANVNDPLNDDGWSRLRTIGMPTNHTVAPLSGYSTPPDVWGRAAMAVDYTGQPLWFLLGTGERLDDPYEVQWNPLRASYDAPYTVSEMEALLRYHDQGAAIIPSRLMTLAGGYLATESRGTLGPSQLVREAFGMGMHIPAPRMNVPRELRTLFGAAVGNSTILDLYYYRLGSSTADFQTVVPFEFLKGQMFNLNREFGNGIDDNGNNVVDEPAETALPEQIPTSAGPYNLEYLNDTPAANTPDQRHMYARHLYCLAMFLRNTNYPDSIDFDSPPNGPSAAETARAYAQWAINVVDFRDPDAIMTPFEYDINPGNGWSVDGALGSGDDMGGERGLVWGCERPELLITETASFHDRQTEDRMDDQFGGMDNGRVADVGGERDGMVAGGTNDFDQRLRPRGATFIELYNPWYDRGVAPNQNLYDHKPAELYNTGGVDIALVNGAGWPVWRMLVVTGTSPTNKNKDPDYPGPEALTVGFNGAPPPVGTTVERSIYFADMDGGASRPGGDGEAYFPSSNIFPAVMPGSPRIPPIMPGRYAVLGSAGYADGAGNYSTNMGWRSTEAGPPARPTLNPRQIILNPTAQTILVANNIAEGANDTNAASLQSVVAIPIDYAFRNGAGTPQSLTISEPVGDYPAQPGYVAPTPTEEGYYAPPIDAPFDFARTDGGNIFALDQTAINYRALHLQRLANPLNAWDPVSNPYMTVDTSSMDVMSFNGATDDSMDPQAPPGGQQNFQSFQRGGRFYDSDVPEMVGGYSTPGTPRVFRELWSQESPFGIPTGNSPVETAAEPHFSVYPLYHTLGGLNRRFYPYFGVGAPPAYRGAPYFQDETMTNASPFPYFAFNNRPFNNVMELLQVPAWQSSKVLEKFNGQNVQPFPTTWTSLYQNPPPGQAMPYGHLPNFFHTSDEPDIVTDDYSPEFGRVLDYVETRTPYVDTEKYYSPALFATPNPVPPEGFRPPYNYLSRFREPGRININTVFDSNVWNAAVRGFPGMCTFPIGTNEGDGGAFLQHLVLSRQGYGATGADVLQHDATFPSLFSHPFRTADSSDLMPPLPVALRKSPADGGLLRRDANPLVPPPTIDDDRPLFGSDNTLPRQDSARNPYFRYQGLQKIGNVFSTNSNVFAVWVTVGYFEVEGNDADNDPTTPFAIDAAHPDGLRLAQEVGADSGEVKRHRAFYIIDRSIPVGYEPGHRHNTDKAILLKRFIE